MNSERCTRCDSIILDGVGNQPHTLDIARYIDRDQRENTTAVLCSVCWDDLWEWAVESDIDRSNTADPISVSRMADDVRSHIDALESVLADIEEMVE